MYWKRRQHVFLGCYIYAEVGEINGWAPEVMWVSSCHCGLANSRIFSRWQFWDMTEEPIVAELSRIAKTQILIDLARKLHWILVLKTWILTGIKDFCWARQISFFPSWSQWFQSFVSYLEQHQMERSNQDDGLLNQSWIQICWIWCLLIGYQFLGSFSREIWIKIFCNKCSIFCCLTI